MSPCCSASAGVAAAVLQKRLRVITARSALRKTSSRLPAPATQSHEMREKNVVQSSEESVVNTVDFYTLLLPRGV